MGANFDHNASTPLAAEALDKMLPYLQSLYGNPSSLHQSGRVAKSAIETARAELAECINCYPDQIIFTSGGTESNKLVLNYVSQLESAVGSVEHASVLENISSSASNLSYVPVNEQGVYQIVGLPDVKFISIQYVNNETGVVQPVAELRKTCQNALLHVDASQAVGKLKVDFLDLGIDFMTLSAHKFNGPKGVGALVVKDPISFSALQKGGYQESSKRAGTENVAAIVGMGHAATLLKQNLPQRIEKITKLRDHFEQQLMKIPGVTIFSSSVERVSNTCFFALPFFHGETFLMECDRAGFELASGSACHSSVTEPSHVLKAMGIDESIAINAIRASFGVNNTVQQIDEFIQFINNKLENLPVSIKSVAGF
ncbi:MAG: cysteine desulfurase [Gammaproteobacteria bacterium]|nr:cysteine desulfurase [Gammaproteobacteria bacterium]